MLYPQRGLFPLFRIRRVTIHKHGATSLRMIVASHAEPISPTQGFGADHFFRQGRGAIQIIVSTPSTRSLARSLASPTSKTFVKEFARPFQEKRRGLIDPWIERGRTTYVRTYEARTKHAHILSTRLECYTRGHLIAESYCLNKVLESFSP